MRIYYVGAFPPDWGGVTVKNRDLYHALTERGVEMIPVDLGKVLRGKSVREALRLARALLDRRGRIINGVSNRSRERLNQLFYLVNKPAMRRSILVVMSGVAAKEMENRPERLRRASLYRKIYVEAEGMKKLMEECGLTNVAMYPNGRFRPTEQLPIPKDSGRLRCVFFSKIYPVKGVDIVLDAAKQLPQVEFAIYGTPTAEYKEEFLRRVAELPNVVYHGIFKGTNAETYEELGKYDVQLLPTRFAEEGVPGILVESKIAGLVNVVSDMCYNAELVRDGEEGIVLEQNDAMHLVRALKRLDRDRVLLQRLKEGSRASAEKFYIENYIDDLIRTIRE